MLIGKHVTASNDRVFTLLKRYALVKREEKLSPTSTSRYIFTSLCSISFANSTRGRRIEQKSDTDAEFPDCREVQGKSGRDVSVGHGANKAAEHQRADEKETPIARPVPQVKDLWVDEEVDVCRRDHGGRNLGDVNGARRRDLRTRRKGQERDDAKAGRGAGSLHGILVQRGGGEDQRRLQHVGGEQPEASFAAREIAQLAAQEAAQDEHAEAHADVGQADDPAADAQGADGQQRRVPRLVGREDVEVGEGDGVHDARGEGEHHELHLQEDVVGDVAQEMSLEALRLMLQEAAQQCHDARQSHRHSRRRAPSGDGNSFRLQIIIIARLSTPAHCPPPDLPATQEVQYGMAEGLPARWRSQEPREDGGAREKGHPSKSAHG